MNVNKMKELMINSGMAVSLEDAFTPDDILWWAERFVSNPDNEKKYKEAFKSINEALILRKSVKDGLVSAPRESDRPSNPGKPITDMDTIDQTIKETAVDPKKKEKKIAKEWAEDKEYA